VKSMVRSVGILLPILLCMACAPKPQPQTTVPITEIRPVYTQNFVTLHLKAAPDLNLYSGSSHALHVCVYQLIDPNPFNQLTEDEMGLSKLMNCERFDAGVGLSKRLVIQPGEESTHKLDRAEGARYVGIVAGYYALKKQNVVRQYPMSLAPMNIELYLGDRAIQDMRGRP
jgi:type VI secretion system VasD/TssJ family lipoprotein